MSFFPKFVSVWNDHFMCLFAKWLSSGLECKFYERQLISFLIPESPEIQCLMSCSLLLNEYLLNEQMNTWMGEQMNCDNWSHVGTTDQILILLTNKEAEVQIKSLRSLNAAVESGFSHSLSLHSPIHLPSLPPALHLCRSLWKILCSILAEEYRQLPHFPSISH